MEVAEMTSDSHYKPSLFKKLLVSAVAAAGMLGFGLSLTVESVLKGYLLNTFTNQTSIYNSYVGENYTSTEDINLIPDDEKIGPVFTAVYTTSFFLLAGITCVIMATGLVKLRTSNQLILSLVFFGFGFLLNGISMKFHFLILIGRFLCGIGLGMSSSVIMPFLEHNITDKQQEFYKSTVSIFISVGAFLTTIFGIVFSNDPFGYRYVFLMYGFFFIVVAIIAGFKGNFREGDEPKFIAINLTKARHFVRKYKVQLFYVGFLHIFQQLALINFIFLNAYSIFNAATDDSSYGNIKIKPEYCPAILTGLGIVSGIIASFLIKVVKNPYVCYFTSTASTSIVLLLLGFKLFQQLFLFLYLFFFYLGLGQLTWTLTTNLGPSKVKSHLCLFGSFIHFVGSCVIPFILKLILEYYREQSHYCYFFAAFVLIVGGIGAYFIFEDAKKRNAEFDAEERFLGQEQSNRMVFELETSAGISQEGGLKERHKSKHNTI